MMMCVHSKGNPAEIQHDKTAHATNVASFVGRSAFLGIVGMSAGISILILAGLAAILFGGIFVALFAAF